jgi:sugar O-acyltransferase (sialic acid O-acetyltransferase NeuD family)
MKKDTSNRIKTVIIGMNDLSDKIQEILLFKKEYELLGFIKTDSDTLQEQSKGSNKVLGKLNELDELSKKHQFKSGIIAIENNTDRKMVFEKMKQMCPEFHFMNVISPRAIIAKGVSIGNGVIVLHRSIINSDAIIDDFCLIQEKVSIGHDTQIGEFVNLYMNTTLGGHVVISELTIVHSNCNIIQNISIGKKSIVETNTLVNKDVMSFERINGIPGKIIKLSK